MPATILVVEDDDDLRALCRIALARHGHRILEAATVDEAELVLDQADLVLLDIRLPGRSGLDLLPAIDGRVPVLVMSAHASEATAAEAIRLGATSFIGKPFDPFLLIEEVNGHLAAAGPWDA